ncbi:Retrotransposon gag domain - like 10 [Theobroma cacao]|nr:Retrotransposon gag domain - like 10 [Theobroma cacao]
MCIPPHRAHSQTSHLTQLMCIQPHRAHSQTTPPSISFTTVITDKCTLTQHVHGCICHTMTVVMGLKEVPDRDNSIIMPPRRELPHITRSTSRGRGHPKQSQPDSIEEKSTASSFRAVPTTEFIDIPIPPPRPVATPGAGPVPPVVSPVTAPVPPPHIPPQTPDVSISKKLKEARQLGYVSFTGELDATAAKDWIISVSETLADMGLDDEMKLKVATRLFEKRARTWWSSVKSRSPTSLTWTNFLREFDGQYYTYFHQKEKKREFLSLKQGNMTIEEYETCFNELILYIPKLVRLEQDQVNYLEEGLRNEIRERMIVTGKESYKKVVQMALRAEKLAIEKRQIRVEFIKRRNPPTFLSQSSKRGRDLTSAIGSTTSASVASTRPPSQQSQLRSSRFDRPVRSSQGGTSRGLNKCRNCRGFHVGSCRQLVKCFQCGQQGHIKRDYPQLRRGTVATSIPPTRPSILQRHTSGSQSRQSPVIRSSMGSNTPEQPSSKPQPQILTRVFVVTEDEARV